jgi:hypothetical protein
MTHPEFTDDVPIKTSISLVNFPTAFHGSASKVPWVRFKSESVEVIMLWSRI